jgi:hypothetical protein
MANPNNTRHEVPLAMPPKLANSPRPIASGVSKSANPRAVSFLDLPGEIRNAIYALVVEFSDHLILGNDPSKFRLYRRMGDSNGPHVASSLGVECQ